jgi:hypothetical protein
MPVGDELSVDAHAARGHVLGNPPVGQHGCGRAVAHGQRGGLIIGHPAVVQLGTDSSAEISAARTGECRTTSHVYRSCRAADPSQ